MKLSVLAIIIGMGFNVKVFPFELLGRRSRGRQLSSCRAESFLRPVSLACYHITTQIGPFTFSQAILRSHLAREKDGVLYRHPSSAPVLGESAFYLS